MAAVIEKSTLQFLKKLKKNNNREWFERNKPEFQKAQANFKEFVQELIKGLNTFDKSIGEQDAAKCVFRIYRDVRFSKNKDPYKTNFGASINAGGKKSVKAGYYIHLDPAECFIGGGIYMPEAPVLNKIRQEIDYNGKEFEKIINAKTFKKYYNGLWMDDTLVNPPKGYEKDNKYIQYIKLKSIVATSEFDESKVLSKTYLKECVDACKALYPLLNFINASFD